MPGRGATTRSRRSPDVTPEEPSTRGTTATTAALRRPWTRTAEVHTWSSAHRPPDSRNCSAPAGSPVVVVSTAMDIVVRTPHGDADVTVGDHGAAARLSTLVADVTGQAPPPVVVVDGRVVDASSTIDSAHLLRGSVIESTSETPDDAAVVVELVQVSGHGTGRRFPLVPGRYRVGPGRRSHADELSPGVVESTRATFVVGPDGSLQIGDRTIPAPSGCFEAGGRWFVTRPLEPVPPTCLLYTSPSPRD